MSLSGFLYWSRKTISLLYLISEIMKSRALQVGLLLAGMAAMTDPLTPVRRKKVYINTGGEDENKEAYNRNRERKGLKEFWIDGERVLALNLKNAQRKAKNKSK